MLVSSVCAYLVQEEYGRLSNRRQRKEAKAEQKIGLEKSLVFYSTVIDGGQSFKSDTRGMICEFIIKLVICSLV